MAFFIPFMGALGSQAWLSARNIFGAQKTTNATSTDNASTYHDPWDDSPIGISDSDRPTGATMTSASDHGANNDTCEAKNQSKDPRMTHIGADIRAFKSDDSKVTTDRKGATSNSDDNIEDEMILDCITVKPGSTDSDIDTTSSSPTDDKLSAGSPTRRKWVGPIPAYLFDSDIFPAPAEHESVAGSPKKRKLVAPMAASLFDEIHSPSPTKRRIFRSPRSAATNSSFNTPFNTPPRTSTMTTEKVDPENDTPTRSPIRLRLASPTQMAVYNSRLDPPAPQSTNEKLESTDEEKEKTERPRPSREGIINKRLQRWDNRRRENRRTSDKTGADLSTVDKKGLLDTWENQKLSTPKRKRLAKCNWVRYRISELDVLMPSGDWVDGPVPRLVLTDPEGRHYELEDAKFPTQMGLPQI
ncbi:hypothetical protein QBC32DRAFT_399707 [Pseudoneurospora amorphoporcata]|uniref:Uncharacterized protein n=1 Tax=Pseudoneurospora amorphoporcata TaxID=241081 RepID=A0AAN6NQH2_9PEZI|nr:hypothetical protein QBC32DRAFT_399707 [Pseudoneurospora amorphoporcata]